MENQDKLIEERLKSEEKYRLLFENMQSGFAYCEIVCNSKNEPVDFIYLEVNDAFKRFAGMEGVDIIGKKVSEVVPDKKLLKKDMIEFYGKVALTGEEARTEVYFERLDKWLSVSVYCPKRKYFVALIQDVTIRKTAEQSLVSNFEKMQQLLEGTVNVLASTVELKDPYTAGHQQDVAQLACAIAWEMELSKDRVEGIRIAALLHDIGKLCVPTEILSKPSGLTKDEYYLVKKHPKAGYDILKKIEFPWPVAKVALQHHERINGSGYPGGITGKDMILESKIIAVADVLSAMSAHRPFRPAKGLSLAIQEIRNNKGILYDPKVADVCFELLIEKKFRFK